MVMAYVKDKELDYFYEEKVLIRKKVCKKMCTECNNSSAELICSNKSSNIR